MAKKTTALVIVLFFITVGLLYAAFILKGKTASPISQPVPAPLANQQASETTLALFPNPLSIASQSGSVQVLIDTGINKPTAAQLEISYDPTRIIIINVALGTFFENSLVLLNNIDNKNGKLSYAIALSPKGKAKTGSGNIATIFFTTKLALGEKTDMLFLPKSLVTAEGVQTSVLKTATGTTILYGIKNPSASQSAVYKSPPVKPTQ